MIEADAEDAAAETFAIAWRRFGEIRAEPLPWLYGVARRLGRRCQVERPELACRSACTFGRVGPSRRSGRLATMAVT